jgi:hypothetical protein
MLKKKQYLVKNTAYDDLYAGTEPGQWTTHDEAKRFKRKDAAQMVANVLSIVALAKCEVIKDK